MRGSHSSGSYSLNVGHRLSLALPHCSAPTPSSLLSPADRARDGSAWGGAGPEEAGCASSSTIDGVGPRIFEALFLVLLLLFKPYNKATERTKRPGMLYYSSCFQHRLCVSATTLHSYIDFRLILRLLIKYLNLMKKRNPSITRNW